ncbi:site-specific integrase [Microbacterium sp. NPDC076911]|uniref:tyrosine-type recombinase/integrase n=1 Tax=Microbacterium sp. NPDC076911 TaxID=3154958 RepID=UPI003418A9A0
MDLALVTRTGSTPENRVPRAAVVGALADARSASPQRIDRSVALTVSRGSDKTAHLRLERLARVVMAADSRVTDPMIAWSSNWAGMSVPTAEAMDRAIRNRWSSVSTRNAMRDSVRAVFRESLNAGILTHDQATPLLNALRPEKAVRDEEKQARGHVPADRLREVFHELASDPEPTARRDAALISLLVGGGLRRAEAAGADVADLDSNQETLLVRGKGGVVRDVPLAPGVRRAIRAWLDARGGDPGPLLNPMTRTKPRAAVIGKRLSTNAIAQIVERRFGGDVAPHDLRRTFAGDLLNSGADLSTVSKVLGHQNPATTAGYDRRGHSARREAVERIGVPFEDAVIQPACASPQV